jgi:hypothetical protein
MVMVDEDVRKRNDDGSASTVTTDWVSSSQKAIATTKLTSKTVSETVAGCYCLSSLFSLHSFCRILVWSPYHIVLSIIMATDLCLRRLTREIKAFKKEPITEPRITIAPNESNILEIHYVIEGSPGTPYEGGVYHGKLVFPKEYPLKPPVRRHEVARLSSIAQMTRIVGHSQPF